MAATLLRHVCSALAIAGAFLVSSARAETAADVAKLWAPSNLRRAAPGIALCCAIAAIAFVANARHWMQFGKVFLPPLIVTLVIGMMLQPLSSRNVLKPGLEFAGRTLLRTGVALYGVQLTLGQLVAAEIIVTAIVAAVAAVEAPNSRRRTRRGAGPARGRRWASSRRRKSARSSSRSRRAPQRHRAPSGARTHA